MKGEKAIGALGIVLIAIFLLLIIGVIIVVILLPPAKDTFFSSTLELSCSEDVCVEGRNTSAKVTITNQGMNFKVLSITIQTRDITFASLTSQSIDITSEAFNDFYLDVDILPKPSKDNLMDYRVCLKLDPQSPLCKEMIDKNIDICTKEQCDPIESFKQIQVIKKEDRKCESDSVCSEEEQCKKYSDGKSKCEKVECEENQIISNHTCIPKIIEIPPTEENESSSNETNQTTNNQGSNL